MVVLGAVIFSPLAASRGVGVYFAMLAGRLAFSGREQHSVGSKDLSCDELDFSTRGWAGNCLSQKWLFCLAVGGGVVGASVAGLLGRLREVASRVSHGLVGVARVYSAQYSAVIFPIRRVLLARTFLLLCIVLDENGVLGSQTESWRR